MDWFLLLCPLAIVGGVTYALIEMIGRSSGNRDSSGSEVLQPRYRSPQLDRRR
jgi:hypothetical protein